MPIQLSRLQNRKAQVAEHIQHIRPVWGHGVFLRGLLRLRFLGSGAKRLMLSFFSANSASKSERQSSTREISSKDESEMRPICFFKHRDIGIK
ncbi:hypothetical protein LJC22_06050 [Desulfosarcina sp. OttesenSCG-928-G10]|nr:hypothetical protein [Desulfosarcina sp. OttesenSCG-928-G10]MDL2322069.1 hypothetical protein [Desulfosarcina sp. OttesenSCG-928-B08]